MTIGYGPRVVTDGLVLALDAADINSFDKNENLLTYSEQFNNGAWSKTQSSITSDVITAPDGSLTADKLVEASISNTYYFISQLLSGGNATYTHSLFAKQAETDRHLYFEVGGCSVGINLSNGTIFYGPSTFGTGWSNPTVSVIPYPNGWYRCIITGTADNTITSFNAKIHTATLTGGAGGIVYTGNGTSGIYIWGAQIEKGSSASTYYSTTATAKTRGTTWIDLTSRGNNGTLTNGPTFNSANGGSIVFDGTNDYVNSTSISSQFTGDITAEAWVYLTSYASDWVRIIGTGGNTGNRTFGLWYYGPTGQLLWQRYGAIDPSIFQASPFLSTGTWHHIVATTSGSSHVLYLNASTIGTATASGPWAASNENITIGFAGFHTYHNGRMSNLKLYNRALTAAEVQQNFQALRGRFGI